VGLAVVASFLLIWINLAVGIIGSEDNPANLMYAGVLAIAIGGAMIARFRAGGMARALLATAIAQALVAAIAIVGGLVPPYNTTQQILVLNGFFVVLWLLSAWLFRRAARERASAQSAS
jgi:hypothetical protein